MSNPISDLRDFLSESPSVVFPQDVLEYLPAIEAENAKLRELASGLHKCLVNEGCEGCPMQDDDGWCVRDIRLRELGVEVDV